MSAKTLTRFFLLPELEFLSSKALGRGGILILSKKVSDFEVCPRCASKSETVYDRRTVTLKDAPHRGGTVTLKVTKRRFKCPQCRSIFTEPISGVKKGARLTKRFERSVSWACQNFINLKKVQRAHRCGYKTIYKIFYKQLELKHREMKNNPWPKTLGIDEHGFSKDKKRGARKFATLFVDYDKKRPREIVQGKSHRALWNGISSIPGRERVRNVVIDLADSYKSFVQSFFPSASIIADKFHVLRLLNPALNRRRIEVTGDIRSHRMRRLLLRNRHKLDWEKRIDLDQWLKGKPTIEKIYHAKERLHRLYRCKGPCKAEKSYSSLLTFLKDSGIEELERFRKTLIKWRKEVLRYFTTRITNARTEAFNNHAKLVQKRAYGFKSFENYRLRVLNACC